MKGGFLLAKVQISIDDRLLEKVDSFADSNYTTRSGLITSALNQYVLSLEVSNALSNLYILMRQISEDKSISEEQKRQLNDIETLVRLFSEK